MSDSDDTDVLLLIPPDFFNIHSSDSEDSFHDDRNLDQALVNNLISHVNELEDRIAHIESKEILSSQLSESLDSMHSSFSSNHIPNSVNANSRRFGNGSANEPLSDSVHVSPSRRPLRFNSLPPTPSTSSHHSYDPFFVGKYNTTPTRNVLSEPSTQGSVTPSTKSDATVFSKPISNQAAAMAVANFREGNMLAEIDTFLDSLKRNNVEVGQNEKKKDQLVVEGLPPSPQKRTGVADSVACLQLDEVDKLLREVEVEQRNIEARLSAQIPRKPESQEITKRTVIKPGEIEGSIPNLGANVRDRWSGPNHFLQNEKLESQPMLAARRVTKPGETAGSIPDLGFGVRESWENSRQKKMVNTPTQSSASKNSTSTIAESLPVQIPKVFASRRRLDLSASNTSAGNRSQDGMEMHPLCNLQEELLEQRPFSSVPDYNDVFASDSDLPTRKLAIDSSTNGERKIDPTVKKHIQKVESGMVGEKKPLLSLNDLWVEGMDDKITQENTKLFQKYEEECCRRQHCEQLVQALQAKLLESQQRLAVALQVDADKDDAIRKLQGAWQSLAQHWHSLEEQRHFLTQELQRQRQSTSAEVKQMQQKLERYETELSKALDLAHGYKEQSENTERTHTQQLEQLGSKFQEVERRLAAATQARNESQAREDTIRKQYEQDHAKLLELQAAMDKATKALSSKEADSAVLVEERETLQTRLKEERARCNTLQQARDKLRADLQEANKHSQILQNELKTCTEQIETCKASLHEFYQSQLERVVHDKMAEFQAQLDTAENTFQKNIKKKVQEVIQLAASEMRHATEKHKVEVSLLEEKHAEELRLVQLQLADSDRQRKELKTRLMAREQRNSNLAERLQAVMENQYKEALDILSSSVEMTFKGLGDASLNVPPLAKGELDRAWKLVKQQQQEQKQAQMERSAQPGAASGPSEHPLVACGFLQSSPVSLGSSDDLKKYIKMLLERSPGNPVDEQDGGEERGPGSSLSKSSQPQTSGLNVNSKTSETKPPWK